MSWRSMLPIFALKCMSMIFLQDSVKYPLSKYATTLQAHNYLASTIAGTHHQTFHVAKKSLFKWLKMIKQCRTIDSWGLQKVDTNSILTCMVADFYWSAQWSAHQLVHFRHKEEQLLMYHNLLVGSLEAGSCDFNLINWLQVRVMITSVKFQKKRLLLFPLERHTTWTVYFTLW
jgi:hypothetical protein